MQAKNWVKIVNKNKSVKIEKIEKVENIMSICNKIVLHIYS